jgi:hypothetical protein
VIINEHENVTFLCHVSSYPISVTGIKLQSGQVLVSAISNDVSYDLGPAKCLDAGMYECSGKNRHNIIHATRRHIGLLVKCKNDKKCLHLSDTNLVYIYCINRTILSFIIIPIFHRLVHVRTELLLLYKHIEFCVKV